MKRRDNWRVHALFTGVLFLAVALVSSESSSQQERQAMYSWTAAPQITGLVVHRDWTSILTYISQQTEIKLRLNIHNSIREFEIAFLKGAPDFAYMSPYHGVMVSRASGTVTRPLTVHLPLPEPVRDWDESVFGQCNCPEPNE